MNRLSGIFLLVFVTCGSRAAFPASADGGPDPQSEIRTLSVQEAVRMTLAHSPEVLLAEAQTRRAREAVRESRSLNLPQVTTGTGAAYNNGFPLSIEGSAPSIFQIGAVQSIFSKKNANLIREAEVSAKANQMGIEVARNELASRTALAYYQFHRARKGIGPATAGLEAAQKQQLIVETQLKEGRARPVEVKQAKLAVASAAQQLLEIREQAATSEAELRELTGLHDAVSIQTSDPQINSPVFELDEEALFQKALESSPEILRAEQNVKAKEFHVESEKGERLPQMEVVSQYALFSRSNNYQDFFNRFTRNNYIIGLSVKIPLFNGFRTSARVAQSRQEVSEEQYKVERMKSDLKLNIRHARSALRIARGQAEVARDDLECAQELVQVNEALLENNRIGVKEMEEFRKQLQQKNLALLNAEQLLFQRRLELLGAVGSVASAIQ